MNSFFTLSTILSVCKGVGITSFGSSRLSSEHLPGPLRLLLPSLAAHLDRRRCLPPLSATCPRDHIVQPLVAAAVVVLHSRLVLILVAPQGSAPCPAPNVQY
jgi:hypothetical protein